jgi:hypothetical protein
MWKCPTSLPSHISISLIHIDKYSERKLSVFTVKYILINIDIPLESKLIIVIIDHNREQICYINFFQLISKYYSFSSTFID